MITFKIQPLHFRHPLRPKQVDTPLCDDWGRLWWFCLLFDREF